MQDKLKKILIIGANSFIGKNMIPIFKKKYHVVGTYYNNKNPDLENQEKLDITNKKEVYEIFKKIKPDVVIILSAVSGGREEKEKIENINVKGVSNVISSVEELILHPKIIFFSTDHLFDGEKGLYFETDAPNPLNYYGKSKLEAENIIKKYADYLILRSSLVLGDKKNSFLHTVLYSNEKLKVFKDLFRTPIYVEDIGKIIDKAIKKDYKGILNISGDQYLSFLEIVQKTEQIFDIQRNYDIIDCPNETIPKKIGLNNNKLKNLIDFNLTNLEEMLVKIKNKLGDII